MLSVQIGARVNRDLLQDNKNQREVMTQLNQRPAEIPRTIKCLLPSEKCKRIKAAEMVIKPCSLKKLQDWIVLHVNSIKYSRFSYFFSFLHAQVTFMKIKDQNIIFFLFLI